MCGCEHVNHFKYRVGVDGVVTTVCHRYLSAEAGESWALYIGHVCDDCARDCMKDWIVEDHVHGVGDCHRGE